MAKVLQEGGTGIAPQYLRATPQPQPPPAIHNIAPTLAQITAAVAAGPPASSPPPSAAPVPEGRNGAGQQFVGPPLAPSSTSAPYNTDVDWTSFLDSYGMPGDVKAQIDSIFRQGGDLSNRIAMALAYVRGTPWYQQTYPGIGMGLALGLVSNEKDYRNYLNTATQLYQRYYGRSISGDEFGALLNGGVGPQLLASRLEAHADAQAYGQTTPQGVFSANELEQIGQNQAGLGNAESKHLNDLSDYARSINGIYRQYLGRDLTRPELEAQFAHQIDPATIAKQFEGSAFVNAYRPDLQFALGNFGEGQASEGDLKALGEQQVGLSSPLGTKLQRAFQQAQQRMQGVFTGTLARIEQTPLGSLSPDVGR